MENEKKDVQTRQLRWIKLQTILLACILVVVVIVGIFAATQFKSMRNCIDLIEQNMQTIDTASLNKAVDAFTEAASQFNKIDMNVFNDTVSSLDTAAEKLKDVNVDSLNTLVEALEGVATKLQSTANAISGFFGIK